MGSTAILGAFEWDPDKDAENIQKHGIGFDTATLVFRDPNCLFQEDPSHSDLERRWYCFGEVMGNILTVRFTIRGPRYRIFGAGYWRKGKIKYEKEKKTTSY